MFVNPCVNSIPIDHVVTSACALWAPQLVPVDRALVHTARLSCTAAAQYRHQEMRCPWSAQVSPTVYYRAVLPRFCLLFIAKESWIKPIQVFALVKINRGGRSTSLRVGFWMIRCRVLMTGLWCLEVVVVRRLSGSLGAVRAAQESRVVREWRLLPTYMNAFRKIKQMNYFKKGIFMLYSISGGNFHSKDDDRMPSFTGARIMASRSPVFSVIDLSRPNVVNTIKQFEKTSLSLSSINSLDISPGHRLTTGLPTRLTKPLLVASQAVKPWRVCPLEVCCLSPRTPCLILHMYQPLICAACVTVDFKDPAKFIEKSRSRVSVKMWRKNHLVVNTLQQCPLLQKKLAGSSVLGAHDAFLGEQE